MTTRDVRPKQKKKQQKNRNQSKMLASKAREEIKGKRNWTLDDVEFIPLKGTVGSLRVDSASASQLSKKSARRASTVNVDTLRIEIAASSSGNTLCASIFNIIAQHMHQFETLAGDEKQQTIVYANSISLCVRLTSTLDQLHSAAALFIDIPFVQWNAVNVNASHLSDDDWCVPLLQSILNDDGEKQDEAMQLCFDSFRVSAVLPGSDERVTLMMGASGQRFQNAAFFCGEQAHVFLDSCVAGLSHAQFLWMRRQFDVVDSPAAASSSSLPQTCAQLSLSIQRWHVGLLRIDIFMGESHPGALSGHIECAHVRLSARDAMLSYERSAERVDCNVLFGQLSVVTHRDGTATTLLSTSSAVADVDRLIGDAAVCAQVRCAPQRAYTARHVDAQLQMVGTQFDRQVCGEQVNCELIVLLGDAIAGAGVDVAQPLLPVCSTIGDLLVPTRADHSGCTLYAKSLRVECADMCVDMSALRIVARPDGELACLLHFDSMALRRDGELLADVPRGHGNSIELTRSTPATLLSSNDDGDDLETVDIDSSRAANRVDDDDRDGLPAWMRGDAALDAQQPRLFERGKRAIEGRTFEVPVTASDDERNRFVERRIGADRLVARVRICSAGTRICVDLAALQRSMSGLGDALAALFGAALAPWRSFADRGKGKARRQRQQESLPGADVALTIDLEAGGQLLDTFEFERLRFARLPSAGVTLAGVDALRSRVADDSLDVGIEALRVTIEHGARAVVDARDVMLHTKLSLRSSASTLSALLAPLLSTSASVPLFVSARDLTVRYAPPMLSSRVVAFIDRVDSVHAEAHREAPWRTFLCRASVRLADADPLREWSPRRFVPVANIGFAQLSWADNAWTLGEHVAAIECCADSLHTLALTVANWLCDESADDGIEPSSPSPSSDRAVVDMSSALDLHAFAPLSRDSSDDDNEYVVVDVSAQLDSAQLPPNALFIDEQRERLSSSPALEQMEDDEQGRRLSTLPFVESPPRRVESPSIVLEDELADSSASVQPVRHVEFNTIGDPVLLQVISDDDDDDGDDDEEPMHRRQASVESGPPLSRMPRVQVWGDNKAYWRERAHWIGGGAEPAAPELIEDYRNCEQPSSVLEVPGGGIYASASPARRRLACDNVTLRIAVHGGSDWDPALAEQEFAGRMAPHVTLALEGISVRYDEWLGGGGGGGGSVGDEDDARPLWRLAVTVRDLSVLDSIETSVFGSFVGYDSQFLRPTRSDMASLVLDAVRVRGAASAEHRLSVDLLPLRFAIDQDTLEFVVDVLGHSAPPSPRASHAAVDADVDRRGGMFFQRVDVAPVHVDVSYRPKRVDLSGGYAEAINVLETSSSGAELPAVAVGGMAGWQRAFDAVRSRWSSALLDMPMSSALTSYLRSWRSVRPFVNIGSGVADLVALPIDQYRRDGRILRGAQRGAASFLHSLAAETIGVGARVATGTRRVLQNADDYCVAGGGGGDDDDGEQDRRAGNRRPDSAAEGLRQGYESMRGELARTHHTLIAIPRRQYEAEGLGSALSSVARAVPIAVIRPMIAITDGASKVLVGAASSDRSV
jgi:ATG2/VPS13, C terminal domain